MKKKLLLILLSILFTFCVYAQQKKPIIFLGKVKYTILIPLGQPMFATDVRLTKTLYGKIDSLNCDSTLRIVDLFYAYHTTNDPRLDIAYISDYNLTVTKGDTYLFFLKDSLAGTAGWYTGVGDFGDSDSTTYKYDSHDIIFDCTYGKYVSYDSIVNFPASLVKTNEMFYEHAGFGNVTYPLDLKNKILPDSEIELFFDAKKPAVSFEVLYLNAKKEEVIIFDSESARKKTIKIPLSKINVHQAFVRVKGKSDWKIRYRIFCKWLE